MGTPPLEREALATDGRDDRESADSVSVAAEVVRFSASGHPMSLSSNGWEYTMPFWMAITGNPLLSGVF